MTAMRAIPKRAWRVLVTESRCAALVTGKATRFVRPVQTEEQARALIALLASGTPDGSGPWRLAVAGGQRVIASDAQR
jgi:hypothetical protein